MSNYTQLGLVKQTDGENTGTWGDVLNESLIDLLDDAIGGYVEVSVASGNVTLAFSDGTADNNGRHAIIKFTGSPGTSRTVTFPNKQKTFYINNGSNDSVVCTAGSGAATVTIPTGTKTILYIDGSDEIHNMLETPFIDMNGKELILDANADTSITADTDDQIDIKVSGTDQITIKDGAVSPVTDSDIDLGTSSLYYKNAYIDAITTTGNVVVGGNIDLEGDIDVNGTLETDALTIAGITLAETISDTVGTMVTSNTESGITVAYDDADNTLDFTVGTLNQDTTGNAATATILETARTIGGTSFDGSANIAVGLAATATALATARTIHGVSFDGTANIDLSEVISDTVGAMVASNTETGIAVTYDDADNTLDFVIGAGTIVNSMLADDAVGADELAADAVVNASVAAGAAIVDTKLATIATANKVSLTAVDIDGGTDIGADLTTSDLIVVDDGAGGTNRKAALSRVVTLMAANLEDPTALAIALG